MKVKKKAKKKVRAKEIHLKIELALEQISTLLTGGRCIILDRHSNKPFTLEIMIPGTSPYDYEDTLDEIKNDIEMNLVFDREEL